MKAYILLSTKPGTSLEVVKRIKEKVKETIVADAIFGRYDAVIILEAPALENINQVVYKIIEKDPNVIRTETSIALAPMEWTEAEKLLYPFFHFNFKNIVSNSK
jgi:DNA-binding Lrp family transcriptional regulator